jgi:hypothetical protein
VLTKKKTVHTKTPVLTTCKTSKSWVKRVAKDPKDTPSIAVKQMPVNSPIWKRTSPGSQRISQNILFD